MLIGLDAECLSGFGVAVVYNKKILLYFLHRSKATQQVESNCQ